jgi:hypothetical protein
MFTLGDAADVNHAIKFLRHPLQRVSQVDMVPFGVTIPATVPQGSEIPEGLMNNPVYYRQTQQTFNININNDGRSKSLAFADVNVKSFLYVTLM